MAELPQDAADPATRLARINTRATEYEFQEREGMGMQMLKPRNSVTPTPLGSVDLTNFPELPAAEQAGTRWHDANQAAAQNAADNGGFAFIHNAFINKLRFPFDNSSMGQRLDNFYSAYVSHLGRPTTADSWESDPSFALQRLCGANPVKIRQVRSTAITADASECSIRASHFGTLLDGMTLTSAINQNLVHVCDYVELKDFVGSVPGQFNDIKHLTAPIAVFFWDTSGPGELKPVAIQLTRGQGQPVFRPGDVAWPFAKAAVQTADAVVHEVGTHLIRSHAAMEAFPIAAARSFSDDHPLYQLLKPHFKNFLQINSIIGLLTDEGKVIDILFPMTHVQKASLASQQYSSWNFNRVANPVNEIADRFMDAANCPVVYPYRDDAMLLWDAIKRFVGAFVDHWYPADTNDSTPTSPSDPPPTHVAVVADNELQGFAHALIDDGEVEGLLPTLDPGNMPGSNQPVIRTREELATFVSTIIFTAGPYHSAVNYPQYDQMGWVPNAPFAGYLPPPTARDALPEGVGTGTITVEDHFPPDYTTRLQVLVMYLLSYQRYDRFGHYPPATFDDDESWELVKDFQCDLAQVEVAILRANETRPMDYPYLLPANITNSTSI